MMLFYPAQMSGGTFIHLLAVHIAVLIFIFFFLSVVYLCLDLREIYMSLKQLQR